MIEYNKFTLPNGLTVIHHLDESTPLACINILYDVGARDEDENKTGFAHLFEHLMFGGSINILNYDEPLQMVGGENNAFTNNDITNYYLTLPAANIETGFWLESDRMLSLAFTDKSLEVQRSVVIEEFKQRYLNQPYGDVWLLLKPLAYHVHPYRWNTIGKEISHIENATMDDVKSFFFQHYIPANAIMVVAGQVSLETTKQLAEKWFSTIPAKAKPVRNLTKEPAQKEAKRLTVYRPVPISSIYKAWHICNRNDEAYHTFDIISDILSNGKSSRLYQSLVKDKKLFSEINAYVSGDIDEGLFVISGKISDGITMEEAENAIDNQITLLQQSNIAPRELDKVKNKVESVLTFGNTNVLNKAMNLAYYELLGNASWINDEGKKYEAVTVEKVKQVAQKYFTLENSITLLYLAESEKIVA
jgi:predicted Zn-dependent peptidase